LACDPNTYLYFIIIIIVIVDMDEKHCDNFSQVLLLLSPSTTDSSDSSEGAGGNAFPSKHVPIKNCCKKQNYKKRTSYYYNIDYY